MFDWCRKNINAIEYMFVSHDEVEIRTVDYYSLEEGYLTWSAVPGTSFHWCKPCSKISLKMRCISSDDVLISHGKQPAQKATVIMDDCQPGKYIACVYDKK